MGLKIISEEYEGAVKVVRAEVDGRPVTVRGVPGSGTFSFVGKIKDFRPSQEAIRMVYEEFKGPEMVH